MRNCTNTRLLRKMLIVLLLCSFIAGTFTACSDKKQSDGKTTFTVGFDAEFPPYGYKDTLPQLSIPPTPLTAP